MTYKYNPPSAPPSMSRGDIEDEFRRWNQQAGETVVSDYDLPMMRPGQRDVTVRFLLRGVPMRVHIDRWGDFATNLRCAYLNIRDMRLAEARGSLESMRETLTALPAGDHWGVLGLRRGASEPEIREAYRLLAQKHHPDHGGDPELMARLNAARDKALAEVGA